MFGSGPMVFADYWAQCDASCNGLDIGWDRKLTDFNYSMCNVGAGEAGFCCFLYGLSVYGTALSCTWARNGLMGWSLSRMGLLLFSVLKLSTQTGANAALFVLLIGVWPQMVRENLSGCMCVRWVAAGVTGIVVLAYTRGVVWYGEWMCHYRRVTWWWLPFFPGKLEVLLGEIEQKVMTAVDLQFLLASVGAQYSWSRLTIFYRLNISG